MGLLRAYLVCSILLLAACGARSGLDAQLAAIVDAAGGSTSAGGSNPTGGVAAVGGSQTITGSTSTQLAAIAIHAGYYHTCAIVSDGTLRCWGSNSSGQLGTGNTTSSSVPVAVSGITEILDVSAGETHTCAIEDEEAGQRTVRCWGRNSSGQLGTGARITTTCNRYRLPMPPTSSRSQHGICTLAHCSRMVGSSTGA